MLWAYISLEPEPVIPPLSAMHVAKRLKVHSGKTRWEFDTLEVKPLEAQKHDEYEDIFQYGLIRRNGKPVAKIICSAGPFWEAQRLPISSRYPIVVVRGAYGLGEHWDTRYFQLRPSRVVDMGRSPAMNSNGPVNWRGHRDVWMFDNYDRYEKMDGDLTPMIVLEKVGRDGKLRVWRSYPQGKMVVPEVTHLGL